MSLILWALLVLAGFGVVWIFVVIPSEKRRHERKLEAMQKRIEKREAAAAEKRRREAFSDDDSDQSPN